MFAFNHFGGGNGTTAFESVQGTARGCVVSAFSDSHDDIIAIDPGDVSTRTTIAHIDHAPGFGVFATLAPDGHALAYTALSPDAARPTPDAPAQAAVVDMDGKATLLADDVDLLVPPGLGAGREVRSSCARSSGDEDGRHLRALLLGARRRPRRR